MFDDEVELIGAAIIHYGFVCEFDDARKEVIVALSTGDLQEHQDRPSGAKFFEREEVLRLWRDTLGAKSERLKLAEAVALLVRGRPASKEAWRRLRRRHRGRFPPATLRGMDEAGQALVDMTRRRDVEAWGRFCDRKKATGLGGMAPITDNDGFLAEPLFVDPCEDVIRTEFDRGDGQLNPVDQEYRDVVLNRAQFIEAIKTQRSPLQPERGAEPRTQQDDAPGYRSEDTVAVDLEDAIYLIAFGDDAAAPSGATAVWDDAYRELIRALQLGEVVASGFRHGRGERKEIPALDWINAELGVLKSYAFLKDKWPREKEWEQVRLYRRDIVQRWPSPLSMIQNEPAVDTSSSRPAAISVTEPRPWWPVTAVVAWILARDPSAVADLCRPLPAVDKGGILLRLSRHRGKPSQTARRELFDALAVAEMVAHGDLGTGSGLQPIPAVERSRLRYRYEDGTDRVGPYRDVVIARTEVLQRWPEYDVPHAPACAPLPLAEIQTDRFDAGKSIKRRGGRSAPWIKNLKKYLHLRLQRGDDILNMSLTDLRVDFLSYAIRNQIRNLPKARSAIDEQIKKGRRLVIAERHEHGQSNGEAPLGETLGMSEIRRK